MINCHGVFSEEVNGQLIVFGITESDLNKTEETVPFENLGLKQVIKDRESKSDDEFQVKRMELHSHTVHSDASQTTEELMTQAEKENINLLAITDHNTISAFLEAERTK